MSFSVFKEINSSHIESFYVHKQYDFNTTGNPDDFQQVYDVNVTTEYINAFKECSFFNSIIDIKSPTLIFVGLFKKHYAEMIKHNSIKIKNSDDDYFVDKPYIEQNVNNKYLPKELFRWGIIHEMGDETNVVGIIDYYFGNIILDFNDALSIISIEFKNTLTIFTREYLCEISNKDFNSSMNPTLYDDDKSYNGQEKQLYITTIGLYNEDYELLAVAKIKNPLKKLLSGDIGIIVKFDL